MKNVKIDNSKKIINSLSKLLKNIEFNNDDINNKRDKIINRFNIINKKNSI